MPSNLACRVLSSAGLRAGLLGVLTATAACTQTPPGAGQGGPSGSTPSTQAGGKTGQSAQSVQDPSKPVGGAGVGGTQGKDGKAAAGSGNQGAGAGKPETGKPETGKPETGKPVGGDANKAGGSGAGSNPRPGEAGLEDSPVVPKGTDPQDLAAMRSAEAMLQVEKKLAEDIKAGKLKGLDQFLPFDELTSWPYEDGLKGMPKRVKDLSGKKVLMTGFMLPIDEVQNIKEFLLVQSLWSCCYGSPPDIHGIVRVVMPKGKTTDYFFDPLKITGTFKVEATMMDGYCVDIFQLHAEAVEVVK
jgi:hypothetical protein